MYINIFHLISYMESGCGNTYFDPYTYKCHGESDLNSEYKYVYLENANGDFVTHKRIKKSFDEKNIDISSLILLPQIDLKCLADSFIRSLVNKKIPQKLLKAFDKNSDSFFLIDKYNLQDEWEEYRTRYEVSFASEWCDQNNVNYTLKPLPKTERNPVKWWK